MNRNADLRAAVALAGLCAALALLLPLEPLRLAFALPLVLLLPGYAIAVATFVGRPLGPPQLLLMSIALSLMVLALGGVLLTYLPGGIRPLSWALLLLAIVVGASTVCALRRSVPQSRLELWRPPSLRWPQAALIGAGGLATLAALILAFTTLPAKNALGYSELWMLPRADGAGIRVGVNSQEQGDVEYRLRVAFGSGNTAIDREFSLEPGEERVLSFNTPPDAKGSPVAVNAALLRQDRPSAIYRRVSGFAPSPKAGQ